MKIYTMENIKMKYHSYNYRACSNLAEMDRFFIDYINENNYEIINVFQTRSGQYIIIYDTAINS